MGTGAEPVRQTLQPKETEAPLRLGINSLGVLLYELLVGSPPFGAAQPRLLMKMHPLDSAPLLRQIDPAIPQAVSNLVLHAIAGSGPHDIWAVGSGGINLHYGGSGWAKVIGGTTMALYGLTAHPRGDLWSVGQWGPALRYYAVVQAAPRSAKRRSAPRPGATMQGPSRARKNI